jgi:hypothetical protein
VVFLSSSFSVEPFNPRIKPNWISFFRKVPISGPKAQELVVVFVPVVGSIVFVP